MVSHSSTALYTNNRGKNQGISSSPSLCFDDRSFFGVLDEKTPLNIYDPGFTVNLGENTTEDKPSNPLDNLKPTTVIPASELDT